jgi:hypothetical protein
MGHLAKTSSPQKLNGRPDSCESPDARAALPQNCSRTKIRLRPFGVNSTSVPETTTEVPSIPRSHFLMPVSRNAGSAGCNHFRARVPPGSAPWPWRYKALRRRREPGPHPWKLRASGGRRCQSDADGYPNRSCASVDQLLRHICPHPFRTDFQIRKRTCLGIYLVENSTRPIIIVRKKAAHAGHHGGAWKVAYADFVTAMTALFIVLWLLNSSKQIQVAVGGYFKDRQAPPKEWEPTLQVRERTFL